MSDQLVIGVDLGGTKIASALVTASGEVVAMRNVSTQAPDAMGSVLDRLADAINAHIRDAKGAKDRIVGVGIGSPGIVDAKAGTVSNAVNLKWGHVELVAEMQKRIDLPLRVAIEKDANASVLGEMYFGAGKGCSDLVMLTIGTGFGAGLVIDGRVVRGAYSNASDIGHISITGDGRQCACGARGCVETVLSGSGLLGVTRDLAAQHRTQLDLDNLTTGVILAAAREGDPLAVAVIDIQARLLAQVMAMCVVMTDPQKIILGGGLGEASADLLLPRAREYYKPHFYATRLVPDMVKAELHSSAVGAAAIALASSSS